MKMQTEISISPVGTIATYLPHFRRILSYFYVCYKANSNYNKTELKCALSVPYSHSQVKLPGVSVGKSGFVGAKSICTTGISLIQNKFTYGTCL
jgi:hypothetical protein